MPYDDVDAASISTSVLSIRSMPSTETLTPMQSNMDDPPPYSPHDPNDIQLSSAQDSRTTSVQSLVPSDSNFDGAGARRRLLLIFIHGFMGDETSFQSFPAHVHNLVNALVSESHTVHTKIYPRYRSKKAIQVATNDFSSWLVPHESPDTDVVLVGHSMGGLLAAEIALLPARSPADPSPLRHRLLGTISLDTPFLGMHPGVIKSGLSSLFRVDPSPPRSPQNGPTSPARNNSTPSLTSVSSGGQSLADLQDPNYNPSFPNDVRLPVRTGWKNAQHFVRKHAKNLVSATQQLVTSHIEFGSCLADVEGLRIRYCKIRMLEEFDNELRHSALQDAREPPRVRFVNYYTASTGRPKRPKPVPSTDSETSPGTPVSSFPDVERQPGSQRTMSDDLTTTISQEGKLKEDASQDSDTESIMSDLNELDPLEDTRSEISDATTAVASSEEAAPKVVIEDPDSGENLASQREVSPQSQSAISTFPSIPPPLPQNFGSKTAFKLAVKQHHELIKQHIQTFNEQQKADILRLKSQNIDTPKARREELKAFVESQKAERKRFYESLKADWKSMEDLVKEQMETRRKEAAAKRDSRKDAIKAAEKQAKADRKFETKLEKLDRKCQRNHSKMSKKINKLELAPGDDASSRGYDVSTAPIADTIHAAYSDDTESIASSSTAATRTDTVNSTSSTQSRATARSSDLSPTTSLAANTLGFGPQTSTSADPAAKPVHQPKVKDRKFCILPPKDASGRRDPTWARVFMKDVDEVGAHCGLFFPVGPGEEISAGEQWGERYGLLVQDVAERVETWVGDYLSARVAAELAAG